MTTYAEFDWVVVERYISGSRDLAITPADRAEAIDRLDRAGYSAYEIARRLGVTTRTVTRRRAARRTIEEQT